MNKIEKIKKITNELLYHCHLYYNLDRPEISDTEYDKKFDELFKLEEETGFYLANSPTRKVQGEVLPYLTKVRHSVPMLSAEKSTNIEDVKKFIGHHNVVSSYKLDGATVVVKYSDGKFIQGLSRGSGTDGEDITHTVRMIKNIPMTIPYSGYLEIRGEALIPWTHYNKMNIDNSMGHPRNVASGGLRQLDANEAEKRNIYFYAFTLVNWKDVGVKKKIESLDFLYENGFDVVPHILMKDADIQTVIMVLDRERYGNPTDGWCFEYDDLEYGESLGSTGHHDRRLFALKPAVEGYETYFRGIEYNTCRTGIVSMTALFDPVEIGNTMVSRATLHNCDFFNSLELGENDLITVTKFNEIIPGIMTNETRSGTYKLIDKCPSCGEQLVIKNTGTANVLYCPNESCSARKLARFAHFVSRNCMDINGMSEATIETLVNNGFISTFKDIYHLSDHKEELMKLDGFGKRSVENLLDAIEKSRDVDMAKFMCALGIPMIGFSQSKVLAKRFNYMWDGFIEAIVIDFDFTTIDGFGDVLRNNIQTWYNTMYFEDNIEELASLMRFKQVLPPSNHSEEIIGRTFVITGSLNHFTNRDELKDKIESLGGKVTGSVTAKTAALINNDINSTSSKNKKAQSLNIPIITEEDFLNLIGG